MTAYRRADINHMKAMLTTTQDTFRGAYRRNPSTVPRRCIFLGTINPGTEGYLRDETGGRRFWPVEVGPIDIEAIAPLVDQLWAEAAARYRNGETWWITDGAALAGIESVQHDRLGYRDTDLFEAFEHYLIARPTDSGQTMALWTKRPKPLEVFNVRLFLRNALGLDRPGGNTREEREVRKILVGEGWENIGKRECEIDGEKGAKKVWKRPKQQER